MYKFTELSKEQYEAREKLRLLVGMYPDLAECLLEEIRDSSPSDFPEQPRVVKDLRLLDFEFAEGESA